MSVNSLTQERLKELLYYDPDTGVFTRKTCRGGKSKGVNVGAKTKKGYVRAGIDGVSIMGHRLAWLYMYGAFPFGQIDHINHVRDDNRISNLRAVSNIDNHKNKALSKRNTSGATGVCWYKPLNKWHAQIMVKFKQVHLGYFSDKKDAVNSRKAAEKKYGFHENHGRQ